VAFAVTIGSVASPIGNPSEPLIAIRSANPYILSSVTVFLLAYIGNLLWLTFYCVFSTRKQFDRNSY